MAQKPPSADGMRITAPDSSAVERRPASDRPAGASIVLEDVSKSFDRGLTQAVDDVSLTVRPGETLALLGSSGSGKTTLLKAINRLHEIDSGRILVDGQDIQSLDVVSLRRQIGYVFQGIGLFPHKRVLDNVETVPKLLGWSRKRRRQRAKELLEMVGLPPRQFGKRLPRELSGGQRQRVGVARALAADPDMVLMDEPFGALDAVVRERLQNEVRRISRDLGKTIVLVTHDLFEALALADRIAVLHHGRLEQCATPSELAAHPATEFVAELIATPSRLMDRLESEPPAIRGTRLVRPKTPGGARPAGEVA